MDLALFSDSERLVLIFKHVGIGEWRRALGSTWREIAGLFVTELIWDFWHRILALDLVDSIELGLPASFASLLVLGSWLMGFRGNRGLLLSLRIDNLNFIPGNRCLIAVFEHLLLCRLLNRVSWTFLYCWWILVLINLNWGLLIGVLLVLLRKRLPNWLGKSRHQVL